MQLLIRKANVERYTGVFEDINIKLTKPGGPNPGTSRAGRIWKKGGPLFPGKMEMAYGCSEHFRFRRFWGRAPRG